MIDCSMNIFNDERDLLKYLESVLDMELNIYIQTKLLERMNNTYNRLGKAKKITYPNRRESDVSVVATMVATGIACGIITAVITLITTMLSVDSFFDFINAVWTALVFGVIGVFAGAIVVGSIIGIIRKGSHQNQLDRQYEIENAKYQKRLENDKKRVDNENSQRSLLANDMSLLKKRLSESKENLRCMYDYDILEHDYRNIYAVSSMYGYLKKGRTHSLGFNEATGDQGAYNIYENERRLDRIITNTEEILERMDQVIQNQYVLAEGLKNAEAEIASLGQGVSKFIYDTGNRLRNIENSQALIAYNTERIDAEARMLSWITTMG